MSGVITSTRDRFSISQLPILHPVVVVITMLRPAFRNENWRHRHAIAVGCWNVRSVRFVLLRSTSGGRNRLSQTSRTVDNKRERNARNVSSRLAKVVVVNATNGYCDAGTSVRIDALVVCWKTSRKDFSTARAFSLDDPPLLDNNKKKLTN